MKKINFLVATALVALLSSCGGSKQVADAGYYNNPQGNMQQPQRQRRTVDPTYTLAAQESDKMRAAQSATAYLEDVALENAEVAAAQALAARLETAVIGVRDRYNKNNQVNAKAMTEQDVQNSVKSYFAQRVSYTVIGEPSIYDNPDGTITAYVCVEMKDRTEAVLGKAYDTLSREEIIAVEFDKNKFIEENKEELKKLQEKIGL